MTQIAICFLGIPDFMSNRIRILVMTYQVPNNLDIRPTQTRLYLCYPNPDIGGPQVQDIKPKPNILKNSSIALQQPKQEKIKTKIVLGMEIISCIVCTADRFPNYSELKKHLKHVHSEMEFIKCGLCFRPYLKTNQSVMAELKAHYKESHGI